MSDPELFPVPPVFVPLWPEVEPPDVPEDVVVSVEEELLPKSLLALPLEEPPCVELPVVPLPVSAHAGALSVTQIPTIDKSLFFMDSSFFGYPGFLYGNPDRKSEASRRGFSHRADAVLSRGRLLRVTRLAQRKFCGSLSSSSREVRRAGKPGI